MRLPRGVFISGEAAAKIVPILNDAERRLRRDGVRLHPVVAGAFEELRIEQRRWEATGSEDAEAGFAGIGRSGSGDVAASATVVGVDLTATDVAERWGCTARAVTDLAARESLPGRKVAGSWRFDLTDVEALDAEHRKEAAWT